MKVWPTHQDLLDAPRLGAFTTIGSDGVPHTTAIWFMVDEDDGLLKVSFTASSEKHRNILSNPLVSLFIIDPPTFRTLEVQANAEILPNDETTLKNLALRYNIPEECLLSSDRLIAVLHPIKIQEFEC